MDSQFAIVLNAVIVAVTGDSPRILTVRANGSTSTALGHLAALPAGPLDPLTHRTLEKCVRGWVREQTGLELGYVEQLYTFGDRHRDPIEKKGGPRMLSVAYLALVRETQAAGSPVEWIDCYRFLPWEDWRNGRPEMIDAELIPRLDGWIRRAPDRLAQEARQERASIVFGFDGSAWDADRVLDRYELMYEAGLLAESRPEHPAEGEGDTGPAVSTGIYGVRMALDHRRMLATGIARLRGKIRYRPVVFELLPPTFTLLQLQKVVEALAGMELHKQNFRRLVDKGGLVEGTGRLDLHTGGRPAELFRFRREVLRERRTPGVGIPSV